MKRADRTGIEGIQTQNMARGESMGPIADRTQDHPGSSDLASFEGIVPRTTDWRTLGMRTHVPVAAE